MTREEVVQAALKVERWCAEHRKIKGVCDCPFYRHDRVECVMGSLSKPSGWGLELHLRNRGLSKKTEKPQDIKSVSWHCHDCRQYPCYKHDENPDYDTLCEYFELW